ncbi:hypothetical protein GALL_537310 [mine drainage metagenome]|uniref:DUF4124 domain-containing protein n=1 Tax=mine drainage metagenome TaxID=410659 RepID=A0A1J5PMC6_9ZZZZ
MKKTLLSLLVLATGWLPVGVLAQWQWLDKDGHAVFSDRGPPLNVPEKNILKRPGQPSASALQDGAPAAQSPAVSPAAVTLPKPSGIDKELVQKKKQADQALQAKRKAEEAAINNLKADNCKRAKLAKSGLDSGMRLGRINSQGEREILDDAARAAEASRVQAIIEANCK